MFQNSIVSTFYVKIHKLEVCSEYSNTTIQANFTIKEINSTQQAISARINTPIEIGEKLRCEMIAYIKVAGQWVKIIKLNEKDPCKMMKKYMGENWNEMQRRSRMPLGCPVPKVRQWKIFSKNMSNEK